MHLPGRNAQWDVQCKNLETYFQEILRKTDGTKKYLPLFPGSSTAKKMDPEKMNKILLQTVPNSWAKQAYLQGWDFERRPCKDTWACLSAWILRSKYMKEGKNLKIPNGQKTTVPVLVGNKMEEEPPCHTSPRRAALKSAREIIQAIWVMIWTVQKIHAWCIDPGTLHNSENFLRDTLKRARLTAAIQRQSIPLRQQQKLC